MTVLLEEFLEDANGHLEAAETSLLELERRSSTGVDNTILALLLGNLHTLKGNAGMMGFSTLQQFVHKIESTVKKLEDEKLLLTGSLFEALYASINSIREALQQLQLNPAISPDFSDAHMLLDYIMSSNVGQVTVEKNSLTYANKEEYGYITQKSTSLKVNFSKLDELLNLVGELVIHRTTLTALDGRMKDAISDRSLLDDFTESSQLIGKTAADLREAIMKVRMLPVKVVFHRFNRLVRDLSRLHNKNILLSFSGEDTELDKTVIDEIGEPLLHLIRNAIDHGIESPVDRKRLGKSETGTICLSAWHESNHIVISVQDDGRGMSADSIKASAIIKGLINTETAEHLSSQEALQLVFLPGFSTSDEVTETSGRGIGLDVVKKTVTSFNGIIEINSRPGYGTTFIIKLPLTLAIISALMVDVAGQTYAIPLSGVLESIRIEEHEIHQVAEGEIIKLRDRLLPIFRLDKFFGIQNGSNPDSYYVVIVGSGEKQGGLVVGRLVGQQEIVIKALDDYLGDIPGISGGTVLGDGKISLIIDIASFFRQSHQ